MLILTFRRPRQEGEPKQNKRDYTDLGVFALLQNLIRSSILLPLEANLVSISGELNVFLQRIREDMTLRFQKQEVGSWKLEVVFSQLCTRSPLPYQDPRVFFSTNEHVD